MRWRVGFSLAMKTDHLYDSGSGPWEVHYGQPVRGAEVEGGEVIAAGRGWCCGGQRAGAEGGKRALRRATFKTPKANWLTFFGGGDLGLDGDGAVDFRLDALRERRVAIGVVVLNRHRGHIVLLPLFSRYINYACAPPRRRTSPPLLSLHSCGR
jgi:hypothetical protein